MSEFGPLSHEDRAFQHERMIGFGRVALERMARAFFGEEEAEISDNFDFRIREENQKGTIVPGAEYDPVERKVTVVIEPDSISDYAEEIGESINEGVVAGDVTRVLIGAGVAKALLGWHTTYVGLEDEDVFRRHTEALCRTYDLWESAATFDETHDSNIMHAVERLGDDELMRVNWLRFSLGASLRHMSDIPNLQGSMVEEIQKQLLEEEHLRAVELEYNLTWQEPDSAFRNYDSKAPLIELAFSFPMSPAEEQQFMNY